METSLDRAALDDLRRLAMKPVPLDQLERQGSWSLSFPDAALYWHPERLDQLAAGVIVAVRAFGAWRHGRVQSLGRTLAVVAFVTPSSPDRLHKPAAPLSAIRRAYPHQADVLAHVR